MATETRKESAKPAATRSADARWDGGMRCVVTAGRHEVVVDEPEDAGGTDTGPEPTYLLLTAASSCYALALVWAANRRGVSLPDLAVTATGTYSGTRFSHLRLTVTTGLPRDQLEPLLEPARKVCYVTNTFSTPAEVEIDVAE